MANIKIHVSIRQYFLFALFGRWIFAFFRMRFPKAGTKYMYIFKNKIGWIK